MASPATSDLRELERALRLATDQGATREFASLREEFEVGHDDMEAMLDLLRTHGKAVEDAPGEWRAPYDDEGVDDDDPEVEAGLRVSAETDESAQPAAAAQPGEAQRWGFAGAMLPHVRLTRSIAAALEAEALGRLVLAGIADTDGVFVLEVVP